MYYFWKESIFSAELWSSPLLIGLFNLCCCKYSKLFNNFALQGTNEGEFYTDVCRNDSAPTISFALKFSSSAKKGGITKFCKELHFQLVLPDI